jgi:hypothetical protein
MAQKLAATVDHIGWSVRVENILATFYHAGAEDRTPIRTVGQLCRLNEDDLLMQRSFGKRCLQEVKQRLSEIGLSLGMTEPEGPPKVELPITLRDWFAGQALVGMLASGLPSVRCAADNEDAERLVDDPSMAARIAFNHADAMLAERARRQEAGQ